MIPSAAAAAEMFPVFVFRLLLAGVFGAVIGFDREYRAKEAGIRTHFLVSLGSALIMIVSQWGFTDVFTWEAVKLDPSRVAAQIVSGIGFIGAGTIMMHKQFVRGLTTAAGLWAVAGIGIAVGGGLYLVALTGTVLVLIGLEILGYFTRNIKSKCSTVTFLTRKKADLIRVTDELNKNDFHIVSYTVEPVKQDAEKIRVQLTIRTRDHGDENMLVIFMQQFDGLELEKIQ